MVGISRKSRRVCLVRALRQLLPTSGSTNVVCTPHIAGSSKIGWATIRRRAGEEAARFLRGERPEVIVNPEVLGRLRG